MSDTRDRLDELLRERILVLDGAWGTMIQNARLDPEVYRGERFADHPRDVAGDPDLLNLTRPDVVLDIHRQYLAAGADITTTNTFTATSIGQADYGLEDAVHAMNVEGARLARRAADEAGGRLVAGSLGPLNVTLSLSPKVDDPAYRAVSFDGVVAAYAEQVAGLREGGVDLLLIETIFDTLNAKAAIAAARDVAPELPLWISVTIVDLSGRTLSGQTVEAFWNSIQHADPLIVGINCSLGAKEMRPHVAELARIVDTYTSCHPNAGLPNAFGGYDEEPHHTAELVGSFAEEGLVNIVGGCCGTTPDHVRAIAAAAEGQSPRQVPKRPPRSRFSGLEPFELGPDTGFVMIGERTNVTGSARFRRLIEANDYQGAVDVALEQVRGGANFLDVNMDADLLDGEQAMTTFLNLLATEPEVARIPIMVDSSRFSVLEAGLKCVQGKGIANSISLKEGEETFLEQARTIRRYGAGVVVMAFDEAGQADTVERKVEICGRAYDLLTADGWPPEDIVFDPNVLAVATGIEEHNGFAKAFIEALPLLKERCPGSRTSGGISNLSFSFRGNDVVREAMHSAFLYDAIRAGLDMGIVNAGQLVVYEDIPADLLERLEDVLYDRRPDADRPPRHLRGHRRGRGDEARARPLLARRDGRAAALARARARGRRLHRGGHRGGACGGGATAGRDRGPADGRDEGRRRPLRLGEDVPAAGGEERSGDEARRRLPGAVHGGREGAHRQQRAGAGQDRARDGEGRRARHRQEHRRRRARLQQLRGDRPGRHGSGRHDPRHRRRRGRARRRPLRPDHSVTRRDGARGEGDGAARARAAAADRRRDDVAAAHCGPHRARLRPRDRARDRCLSRRRRRLGPARSRAARRARRRESRGAGASARAARREGAPAAAAAPGRPGEPRAARATTTSPSLRSPAPAPCEPSLAELRPYIDWQFFFHAWELKGKFPGILDQPAARELYDDATEQLEEIVRDGLLQARGVYGFWPAHAEGDDVVLEHGVRFPMLRQQAAWGDSRPNRCLADYVAPAGDHIGAFAVAIHGADALAARYEAEHDDYRSIMVKALADRLAEAFAEYVHLEARRGWYEPDAAPTPEELVAESYRGIRPAFGYPACPDHSEKGRLFELLGAESAGLALTESFAMTPAAAVSGLLFGHPQAKYFAVGRLARDQVEDYAARKAVAVAEVERWLRPNLAYDSDG